MDAAEKIVVLLMFVIDVFDFAFRIWAYYFLHFLQ